MNGEKGTAGSASGAEVVVDQWSLIRSGIDFCLIAASCSRAGPASCLFCSFSSEGLVGLERYPGFCPPLL
jgi:hypothetical protein